MTTSIDEIKKLSGLQEGIPKVGPAPKSLTKALLVLEHAVKALKVDYNKGVASSDNLSQYMAAINQAHADLKTVAHNALQSKNPLGSKRP